VRKMDSDRFSKFLAIYVLVSIVLFGFWMTWQLTEEFENPPPYFSECRFSLGEFITDTMIIVGEVVLSSLFIWFTCCIAVYLHEKIEEKRKEVKE